MKFQSSPVPKDGCNLLRLLEGQGRWLVSILTRPEGRVQHAWGLLPGGALPVSILTRPEGRVQPHVEHLRRGGEVSILTRPEGRVQRSSASFPSLCPVFQSSPVPKDGCNCYRSAPAATAPGFNPHPSRRTGATNRRVALVPLPRVSILTRPEGRVQRRTTALNSTLWSNFSVLSPC